MKNFTTEKLAQIDFSYFLLEVTTFSDYRISKKNNVNSLIFVNSHLGQKSPWTKVCLDNCPLDKSLLGQLVPWTTVPWTIVATPLKRILCSYLRILDILVFHFLLYFLQQKLYSQLCIFRIIALNSFSVYETIPVLMIYL